ncbi:hypothetical protein MJI69_30945, partial [Salmonella enterica subsp. enterica serovar Anatum]|nr:hypothetical protein [Salmonella enterica subsp. enterica serovar Anatum]
EMYPVPPRPETQGLTESYIGNWLAKRGNREKLIIASKVSGPAPGRTAESPANLAAGRKSRRAGRRQYVFRHSAGTPAAERYRRC